MTDEPLLKDRLKGLPGNRSVAEWLEFLRSHVEILNGLSPLQMREFLLDSEVKAYKAGEAIFVRNGPGSSLFGIAEGSVKSEREFRQALKVSLGSAAEVEYQFMLARDLGYLAPDDFVDLTGRVVQIRKMLTAFIRTIDRSLGDRPAND